MSIEGFCASLQKQLKDLHTKRDGASGSEKGQCTRKIHEIELALKKATRKGLQE